MDGFAESASAVALALATVECAKMALSHGRTVRARRLEAADGNGHLPPTHVELAAFAGQLGDVSRQLRDVAELQRKTCESIERVEARLERQRR